MWGKAGRQCSVHDGLKCHATSKMARERKKQGNRFAVFKPPFGTPHAKWSRHDQSVGEQTNLPSVFCRGLGVPPWLPPPPPFTPPASPLPSPRSKTRTRISGASDRGTKGDGRGRRASGLLSVRRAGWLWRRPRRWEEGGGRKNKQMSKKIDEEKDEDEKANKMRERKKKQWSRDMMNNRISRSIKRKDTPYTNIWLRDQQTKKH